MLANAFAIVRQNVIQELWPNSDHDETQTAYFVPRLNNYDFNKCSNVYTMHKFYIGFSEHFQVFVNIDGGRIVSPSMLSAVKLMFLYFLWLFKI